LNRLSDDMSVEVDDENVVLYSTQGHIPKCVAVITSDEMRALQVLYTDGRCPVCMVEIPEGDVICDACFDQARSRRS